MRKFAEAAFHGVDPETCRIILKNMIQYGVDNPGWFYSDNPIVGVTLNEAAHAFVMAAKAVTAAK